VGAGDAGQRIVRQMKEDRAANLVPIGFLDDDPSKLRKLIHGVSVLGPVSSVEAVARDRGADQILIAIPSLSGTGISSIVRACAGARADLTILPTLPQLVGTGLSPQVIRKVSVEDLLERSPIYVDMDVIAAYTTGQRILVTGAGGSIGSELCRQIVAFRPESLVLLGHGENSLYWIEHELRVDYGYRASVVVADVKDRHRLEAVYQKYHPTVVFHAAAHKHVPMMESNPGEAVKNNVFGTRNLAELAMKHGVRKFVFISTDKAVNPTSVMGTTKRVSEMIVQSLAQRVQSARQGCPSSETWAFGDLDPASVATEFTAVRFGNVLGSNGSVIPTMERQIARGGPVTVTHPEMTRFFMTIPEAVQLVIQAGGMGKGGEVFVLDMGQPVRIMDLAWNLVRLSGLVPNVDIKIEVTGMRPGEKLYEEVLTAEEGTTITNHQKIHVAKASPIDHAALRQGLEVLWRAAYDGDADAIRDTLLSLVPTYRRLGRGPAG
jgi:FlaA1/EpsC-like NDP-sugar epimerase